MSDLYQAIILDHNRRPRNFHVMEGATGREQGVNPLCGDQFTVFVRLDGDVIAEASFQGSGCAISKASASMMTAMVTGKTRAEAESLFQQVHDLLVGKGDATAESLGSLRALGGVSRFPMRVKCASLPWHTLRGAIAASPPT
ncbi:MAG: SUF system NifU family Fe-S cluster assembly protein [Gemmatimonadota bacterium]|nr:SUF system NifU family Fe-S cluster assembly protein [Gemmatimonadota bacterium]